MPGREATLSDGAGSLRLSKLTPREQARLARILTRLASPFEGERAAAGLLATVFMDKHGLTWFDLTMASPPAMAQPTPEPKPPQDRRHGAGRPWRGYCRRHPRNPGHALSCFA